MHGHLYDDSRIDNLVEYTRAGNYVTTATMAAGIDRRTYYDWFKLHRKVDAALHELDSAEADDLRAAMLAGDKPDRFSQKEARCWVVCGRILLATAAAEADCVALIRRAMPRDFLAAVMFLERRHPSRWRRRSSVTVEHDHEPMLPGSDDLTKPLLLEDPQGVKMAHDLLTFIADLEAKNALTPPGDLPQ